MQTFETDNLTSIVGRVLRIDDITIGGTGQDFLARYRGQLYDSDSGRSYDQLASNLRSLNITPLFRTEGDQHVVLLVQGRIEPRPSNPLINLVLFIFTVLSVIFAGALYSYSGPIPSDQSELLAAILHGLANGIPFAVSLLAILLAHEFGHYIAGRYHHTHVTLPYFIPFPLSPFGTMGAFIQLKEPPKNKRILLDIGVSGPIAGLVVAFPILLYGLSLSHIETIILPAGQGIQLEGNSLLYLLAKYIVFGQLLPAPSTYGDLPAFLYWVRYFFTSQPLPLGGIDVFISPIAWAGWAGLLVTALNLIPTGQLDGGHVIYSLFGKRSKLLLPVILVLLVLLGFVWSGWWIWAFLILLMGRMHAEPLDTITPLDPRRKALAVVVLFIFFLVFTPVPLIQTFAGA